MKSKLNGWDTVFKFTLLQLLKGKSFIVSTIMLVVICFVTIPLLSSGKASTNMTEEILKVDFEKIYFYENVGLSGDMIKGKLEEIDKSFEDVKFEKMDIALEGDDAKEGAALSSDAQDKIEDEFASKKDCNDNVLVVIYAEEGIFNVKVIRSEDSKVGDMEVGIFEENLYDAITETLYDFASIKDEQIEFIKSENKTEAVKIVDGKAKHAKEKEDNGNPINDSVTSMGLLMIVVIILAIGGEAASTSMITEKASRAIEYVLTSVRPLALVLGKVLACIATQFIEVGIIAASIGSSMYVFSHGSLKKTEPSELAQTLGVGKIAENADIASVLMAVIILLGGIVFYITLACLIGSTASKMEELTHTNMIYSTILIVGMYIAMFTAMSSPKSGSPIEIFMLLFPLSSSFVTPMYLLSGQCSMLIGAASVVCMLIAVVLLIALVAKVFEAVIMFNGSKVTFSKMMEFAGLKKESKKVKGGSANES